MATAKTYVAGKVDEYLYPALGDPTPPGGAKVLLLNEGGVCVIGPWAGDGRFVGWAPLPKRNHAREAAFRTPLPPDVLP